MRSAAVVALLACAFGLGAPDGGARESAALADARPVWSPDGRWISFTRGNTHVVIRRSGGRTWSVGGTLSWSPGGKRIAIERRGVTTGPEISIAAPDGTGLRVVGPGATPDWSPDGKRIVFSRLGELYLADVSASGVDQVPVEPEACAGCESYETGPKWSPDGNRLAFVHEQVPPGTRPGLSVVVASSDGTTLRSVRRSADDHSPSWSPDGRWIAFVEDRFPDGQKHLWVARASGGRPRELARGAELWWSPRSDLIAYATEGGQGGFQGVRVVGLRGRRALTLSRATSVSWAPDGQRLAFARAGGVYVASLDSPSIRRVGAGRDPAWSPDGRLIAYAGLSGARSGGLYVVRPSGSERRRLTGR